MTAVVLLFGCSSTPPNSNPQEHGLGPFDAWSVAATAAVEPDVQTGPQVIYESHHDTSRQLRDLVRVAPAPRRLLHLPEMPPIREPFISLEPDPVLQTSVTQPLVTPNFASWNGVSGTQVQAPDPNASVGATQVVETTNGPYGALFQVFDKSGVSLLGPSNLIAIWSGFGGECENGPAYGDAIVLYDKAAGRWLVSQMASSSSTSYSECVAVSKTSDATGAYSRYAFSFTNLNDYPKFGVWPDAYYSAYNMFAYYNNQWNPVGAQACAHDRDAMLNGRNATTVCFQRSTMDWNLLPSDLDGSNQPPAGEPNFFLELASANSLSLFKFHVDFRQPSNSTFTGPVSIAVAPFSEYSQFVPQKGTDTTLHLAGDRLMHRLAYRNFGDHESLVANHSVAAGSSVGVRWYADPIRACRG